jgi:hypothetical protein
MPLYSVWFAIGPERVMLVAHGKQIALFVLSYANSVNIVPVQAMKAYRRSRSTALLILNLTTRWR